jgi:hypothetical protein
MALIFENADFIVESPELPLVDRNDGGHITITPKRKVIDRQQLTCGEAIEWMRLSIVAGEALQQVMTALGVPIGRVNYQDNGNWSVFKPEGPQLHLHIFGRAKNATQQKYGQALFFPHRDTHPEFYSNVHPLNHRDIFLIREKIIDLLKEKKFSNEKWNVNE